MKKLLYIGIVLMFGSCGSIESESSSSTVNVEGREVSTIKIDNLEVMKEDLGKMKWDEAKKACENLGDGWRLPTEDELNVLYENKVEIGGFASDTYWSSTNIDVFAIKGLYEKGFSIRINNDELEYENNKLYFPSQDLTQSEVENINKKVFDGGQENEIKIGEMYANGEPIDRTNFETYIQLDRGIEVHYKNGKWTRLREELNHAQNNEMRQAGNILWGKGFSDGSGYGITKTSAFYVRAVRAF